MARSKGCCGDNLSDGEARQTRWWSERIGDPGGRRNWSRRCRGDTISMVAKDKLSHARTVLAYAPELVDQVIAGRWFYFSLSASSGAGGK